MAARRLNQQELEEADLNNKFVSVRAVVKVDTMLNAKIAVQLVPIQSKDIEGKATTWKLSGEKSPQIPAKTIPWGRPASNTFEKVIT